ncbi:MAG: hypothetical protein GXX96_16730 [Planctomycetaceae bacterium]|nr:hypothetical protein [Planctomycetaceae bacterium]
MPKSVLEAIRIGLWDFEPAEMGADQFEGTDAMPGTSEKVQVLASRIQRGLPLWHPADRDDLESPPLGKPR